MVEATLYNKEFIQDLQERISQKVAAFTNKDLANDRYNLGLVLDYDKYKYIWEYYSILGKIIECNSCYNNIKIDDLVGNIQNQLNTL